MMMVQVVVGETSISSIIPTTGVLLLLFSFNDCCDFFLPHSHLFPLEPREEYSFPPFISMSARRVDEGFSEIGSKNLLTALTFFLLQDLLLEL